MNSTLLKFAALLAIALPLSGFAAGEHDHSGHDHAAHGEEGHVDEVTILPDAMRAFGITMEAAMRRPLVDVVTVPARVAYNAEAVAHVRSALRGRVVELPVRQGDIVSAGDVIAVIEAPELADVASDLLQKAAVVEAAKSALDVATQSLKRAEELRASNSIAMSEFLSRQGDVKRAEGELKVAESAALAATERLRLLGLTKLQIDGLLYGGEVSSRYSLRAPIAGTITQREVTIGEMVSPDSEPLLMIADATSLWILAEVPEAASSRVTVGGKGMLTLASAPGGSLAATISYVAPELRPRTRAAEVRLLVDPEVVATPSAPALSEERIAELKAAGDWCPEHSVQESTCALCNPYLAVPKPRALTASMLRPGMFVTAELELDTANAAEPVVVVPDTAIQTVEGRVSVFVPTDKPNTFKPQAVTTGRRVGRFVPVLTGLAEGDQFVSTGSFILKAELGKAGAEHVH